jgi:hypothetical protein
MHHACQLHHFSFAFILTVGTRFPNTTTTFYSLFQIKFYSCDLQNIKKQHAIHPYVSNIILHEGHAVDIGSYSQIFEMRIKFGFCISLPISLKVTDAIPK